MSHVATKAFAILDLPAFIRACEKRKLVFKEGQKTYKWWGRWMNDYNRADAAYRNGIRPEDYGKCEHAVGLADDNPFKSQSIGYEAGLVKNPKGEGYLLILDFIDSGLTQAVDGQAGEGLIQDYQRESLQASQNVSTLVNEMNCVEHAIYDENGDMYLVYEDEGMNDEQVKQYLKGG